MMLRLQITPANRRDLECLRDEPAESLVAAGMALEALGKQPCTLTEIFAQLRQAGVSEDAARALCRQLTRLSEFSQRSSESPESIVNALTRAVDEAGWTSEEIDKWRIVAPSFRRLLETSAFRILTKTIMLASDYSNVLHEARILTDMRPIFDDDGTDIVGVLLTNVMRVKYWNEQGEHSISLAIDKDDIEAIKLQCERALLKLGATKKLMSKEKSVRIIEMGEDVYDLG